MPDVLFVSSSISGVGGEDFTDNNVAAGDFLIIAVSLTNLSADSGALSAPSGFSRLGGVVANSFGEFQRMEIFTKFPADGTETITTVNPNTWTYGSSVCAVYRNVNQIEASNSSTDWVLPVLGLSGTRDMLLGIFGAKGDAQGNTVPGALTQRQYENSVSSSDPVIFFGDIQLTTSGNTTAYSGTFGAAVAAVDFVIALKPTGSTTILMGQVWM